MLDAEEFQITFCYWEKVVNEIIQRQIVNIDGKRLTGSEDKYLRKDLYTW